MHPHQHQPHSHRGGVCTSQEQHTHCHHHHHGHHHHHNHGGGERNILLAFLLNLGFCIIEFVGGFMTGSIAILSDALHDLGDATALGGAWYLERVSQRGRDRHFSYGYKRFSLIGALLISIILFVGSIYMIGVAVSKLFDPGEPDATGMLLLAILGLAINGFAAWRMLGNTSLSSRAIRLHLLEDVLGWAAVLLVSVVMKLIYLPILDPILSLCISSWILYNSFFTLRDNFRILLQGIPVDVDVERFSAEVVQLEGILSLHDLHIWTLNGEQHIGSLHIVCACTNFCDYHSVATLKLRIRDIAQSYGVTHLTIEVDPEGESCGMEHC